MARVTVTLSLRLEEAEADGSACVFCGDMVLLSAFRVSVWCPGKRVGWLPGRVCQSCGGVVRETWKDGG